MAARPDRQKNTRGILMPGRASLLHRITLLIETPLRHPLYFLDALDTLLRLSVRFTANNRPKKKRMIANERILAFMIDHFDRGKRSWHVQHRSPRMKHRVREFFSFSGGNNELMQDLLGWDENLWQAYAAAASLLGSKKKLHISCPHSGVDQVAGGGRTFGQNVSSNGLLFAISNPFELNWYSAC